jgi:hypothetical protein
MSIMTVILIQVCLFILVNLTSGGIMLAQGVKDDGKY